MSSTPSTRRVFLIGFMGAGKTSVGQALARRLRWTFLDLDEVIERHQKKSIAVIFAEAGEAAFRRMESASLRELLEPANPESRSQSPEGLVVALGGGAFAQPHNRAALERAGAVTVLLEAPLQELQRRCHGDSKARPLAGDSQMFERLFAERRGAYELARFRADTMGKTVEEVAAEIACMVLAAAKTEVVE